ncbi:MAG: right-handed parallel beta-helix repeat-containing protein [Planctomycetota bacterium]
MGKRIDRAAVDWFRLKLVLATALVLVVSGVGPCLSARELYVNNETGDDRFEGRTPQYESGDGPCRSIARALFLAQAGDTVVLAKTALPYRESVTLQGGRHSGNDFRPFRLLGNGATLDGRTTIRPMAWEKSRGDVVRFEPVHKSLGMLYLDGLPAYPRRDTAAAARPERLQPGEGCLFDGWYYFRREPDRIISEYALSATDLPVGITLHDVRNVRIEDLVIQGFQRDGLSAADGVSELTVDGLTLRGNGRAGAAIFGASRVTLANCLAGNNGKAQVWASGHCWVDLRDCALPSRSAPAVFRDGDSSRIVGGDSFLRPQATAALGVESSRERFRGGLKDPRGGDWRTRRWE